MTDKQVTPNLVNGFKGDISNTPFNQPSSKVSRVISNKLPTNVPNTNLSENVDNTITILGHTFQKNYVYMLGIVIAIIVSYYLWNWYNNKMNDDEEDDEDYNNNDYNDNRYRMQDIPQQVETAPQQVNYQQDTKQPMNDNQFNEQMEQVVQDI